MIQQGRGHKNKIQENWVEIRKGGNFTQIGNQFHISPITARLIRNREVVGSENIEEYLNGTLDCLHDGILMKDMDKAMDILQEKIELGNKIRIIGDYDIDGVNATYILLEGLGRLGADVDSDIPDRMKDGYGLSIELIERAIDDGVDTIVTCDNGIAAYDEIGYAKEANLTVIVTDHHQVPYEEVVEDGNTIRKYRLPQGDAVIDPKQEGCLYPFKELCGAAVAYKVIETLCQFLGKDSEDMDDFIENVAIATVGDVMDLVGENRIFVKQGLEMLYQTRNVGLGALLNITVGEVSRLEAYHIGFVIGPCINATGRLETAKRALDLLMTKDQAYGNTLAQELKTINDKRKEMTLIWEEKGSALVEEYYMEHKVLVIYLPECHESLAGIIAGRMRERYHKPAFVLTQGESSIKGSGRSIEAYHMYEEMQKCQELFLKYGGHKLAAGFSLEEENIEKLRTKLNQITELKETDFIPKIAVDMQLPLSYLDSRLIEELEWLEPFGKGNTKPNFVEKDLEILRFTLCGVNKNVAQMRIRDKEGNEVDGVCFQNVEGLQQLIIEKYGEQKWSLLLQGRGQGIKMMFIYYPKIETYRGQSKLKLMINHFK